nr:magnesium chelatase [Lachnospiraceae bacterium]
MYARVNSATLCGIDAVSVTVETDVSDGMPVFDMVGVLSGEVREARERVKTALKNNGLTLPVKRITVNFLPANIKKMGSGFDLPVAVSVLCAIGIISQEGLEDYFVAGELGLDGRIHPISGILPMVIGARNSGIKKCVLPAKNVREAELVPDMEIIGVRDLT